MEEGGGLVGIDDNDKTEDAKVDAAKGNKEKNNGSEKPKKGAMIFGMEDEEPEEPEPAFQVKLVS